MKEFIEKLIEKLEEKKSEAENEMNRLRSENYTLLCKFDRADIEENTSENFKESIEIVNELAEEYISTSTDALSGWIPCSERLPSVGVTVLCYWKKYDRYDNTTSYYYTLMHRNEDCQWLSDLGICNGNAIAWQPLPPAYKEGSE